MENNKLKIEYVDISKLKENEYNPKKMSEVEAKNLEKSITEFGIVDPLIVNRAKGREGIIIGGHQRFKIYKKLKIKEVPVVWLDIPDLRREQELCLRLSRNTGSFDFDLLANFDENLLKDIGWEREELDEIFGLEVDDEFDAEKELEKVLAGKERRCASGQLWQLGELHRLYIGDATKKESWEKVLGDERVDMIFTDPPYNVAYKGTKFDKIKGDNLSEEEFEIFLLNWLKLGFIFCKGAFYICMSAKEWGKLRKCFEAMGGHWSSDIIWVKDRLVPLRKDYHSRYEALLYGWNKEGKRIWNAGRKEEDVWQIDRHSKNPLHPTQKPIELCSRAIKNSSQRNQIVMDCFGGSGSALIACEIMKRKCRMIEIDPIYCQVIIDRWEKFTGLKAKKIG